MIHFPRVIHTFFSSVFVQYMEAKYEEDVSSPQGMEFWLGVIKET